MAYTNIHNGIIFIEGDHPNANRGPVVKCDLSFKLDVQLKSLRDVKDNLAKKAKARGFNAVLNFAYGQKSRWLAVDDVTFWGKGCLAKISQDEYDKIQESLIRGN